MSARRSRLIALAVSTVLHAAVVGTVLSVSWRARVERAPAAPIEVVWIERWPAPAETDPAEPAPPERGDEPPESAETVDDAPAPGEPAADGAEKAGEPDEARAEHATDEEDSADGAAAPAETLPAEEPDASSDASDRPRRTYTVRDVDIGDAWRAALEQTREEQRRQAAYRAFSLDDVRPAPLPEEPGPKESVFETAKKADRPASVLSPGSARTRLGQRLARLCNELTGGFSLMGLAAVCADQEALPKLFAHLKPEYLRARPECTEVDAPSAIDAERNAIKCRLVLDDEPTLD